jgi:hypothetical protein
MGVGVLTLLVLAWLQGAGAEPTVLDAEGHSWTAFPHAEGIGLRSPLDSFVLLPSCTARSGQYGKGTWSWANGGFRVLFPAKTFRFPRQEPPLEDPSGRCRL